MRRMFSEKQIKEMISAGAQGEIAEALEGDISIGGDLSVTGDAKLFENIVDAQGHKRFIEGDLTLSTIEGVTFTYGKWSLSGSHLMFVVAGVIANGAELSSGTWCYGYLPEWILDKIYPFSSNVIEIRDGKLYGSDYSSQTAYVYFQKITGGLQIYCGAITATKERSFRFEFDLLIDNDQGE